MDVNYLLAKQIVDEKFDNSNQYYYMFICALFGLFMKYPDNKDLIIKSFRETTFIIEDTPVLDIQKKYDLNLIQEDELEVQDPSVCTNYGVSDLGFGYFIKDGMVQMIREKPMIVCTSKNNSPANLLNVFIHEMNHILKSWNNSHGSKKDGDVSCCYNRCGMMYCIYTYDKSTDILKEEEFYSTLDEVINVFQTTDILKYILMLDGVVPDEDFQEYFDTLDKDEMTKLNGYEKCCGLFKRIWDNDLLKDILERHLIDGELEETSNEFDDAVGMECFDKMADWFDDLDYLFCLNNKRKDLEKCYKMLDKLIKSITSSKIKK